MKKIFVAVSLLLIVSSCKNEQPIQSTIEGTWKQKGFYNELFNSWSFTSSPPLLTITKDSISGAINTAYTKSGDFYHFSSNSKTYRLIIKESNQIMFCAPLDSILLIK